MFSSTKFGCFFRALHQDFSEFGPFSGHWPALLLSGVVLYLGWGLLQMFHISINPLCSGIKCKCANVRDAPKKHGLVAVWCPSGYLQVVMMMEIPGILPG